MIALDRNERLLIDEVAWAVERRTLTGYQLVSVGDGQIKTISYAELSDAFHAGRLSRHVPRAQVGPARQFNPANHDFAARSTAQIEKARQRKAVIDAVRQRFPDGRCPDDALAAILKTACNTTQRAPSLRTVRRWLARDIQTGGCIDALVPKKRGPKGRRFNAIVEGLIDSVIDEVILRPEGGTGPIVYSILRARIESHNRENPAQPLKSPSRASVFRRIQQIDDYERIRARDGKRKADQAYAPVGQAPVVTVPMREVEIDHGYLDCIAVSDDGAPLGRPYITFALDRATRMIVGFVVSFVPPSFASVMMVLRRMILPKDYVKQTYGNEIQNPWPCFGLPEAIIVDNGPEFHSENLRVACEQLGGIQIVYTPTREPRYKGKIERFFGSLNTQLIHFLPGTTFHKVDRERDYTPAEEARFSLREIERQLLKFVIDVYHPSYHRGLKDVPLKTWERLADKHPARIPYAIQDLDALTNGIEMRKIGRQGIELLGQFYISQELVALRIATKGEATLEVRYDPLDLGSVCVKHPTEGRFLRVPCTNPNAKGLSEWEHRAVMNHLRDKAKGADSATYHQAVKDLHGSALTKTRGRKGKIAGRRAARLLEASQHRHSAVSAAPSTDLDALLETGPQSGIPLAVPLPDPSTVPPTPRMRRASAKPAGTKSIPKLENQNVPAQPMAVPSRLESGSHTEVPCGDDLDAARVRMGISVRNHG